MLTMSHPLRQCKQNYVSRICLHYLSFYHRYPNAIRSDSVRRLIGFRSPSDWIPSAARSDCVRVTMTFREVYVERLYLGGALVSARLCRLPEQEVHRPSYWSYLSAMHCLLSVSVVAVLFLLGWFSFSLVGAVLSWLVHLRQVHPLKSAPPKENKAMLSCAPSLFSLSRTVC